MKTHTHTAADTHTRTHTHTHTELLWLELEWEPRAQLSTFSPSIFLFATAHEIPQGSLNQNLKPLSKIEPLIGANSVHSLLGWPQSSFRFFHMMLVLPFGKFTLGHFVFLIFFQRRVCFMIFFFLNNRELQTENSCFFSPRMPCRLWVSWTMKLSLCWRWWLRC